MRKRIGRDAQPRLRRDVGATLAEYALIFSLLIVGSVAAVEFLSAEAGEQIDNNADCVSKRPPPVECQTPAQSVPDDYDSFPPTTPSYTPPSGGTASFGTITWTSGTKTMSGPITIASGGTAIPDATVYFKVTCNGSNFFTNGTTNASGIVTFSETRCTGPGTATVQVYRVDSSYNVTVPINTTVTMT